MQGTRAAWIVWSLAGLLGSACGAGASQKTSPRQAIFTLVEYTEDGARVGYPEAPSLVDVDVNSTVGIELDRNALLQAKGVDTGLVEELERLRALQGQYNEALQHELRAHEAAMRAYRAWERSGQPFDPDAMNRLVADLDRAGQRSLGQFEALVAYVQAREGSDANRVIAAYRLGTPQRDLAYLAREHRRLQAAVTEEIAGQGVFYLELSAWNGTQQLHLPGYDDLAPGPPSPVDKRRFVFDQGFEDEVEAARKLAAAAGEQNGIREQMLALLHAQKDALLVRLRALPRAAMDIDALRTIPLASLAPKRYPETRKLLDQAKVTYRECRGLLDRLEALVQILGDDTASQDPGVALRSLVDTLKSSYQPIEVCTAQAMKLVEQVSAAASEWNQALPPTVKTKLEATRASSEALVGAMLGLKAAGGVAWKLPPELETIRRDVDTATDTMLSLVSSKRSEGDTIVVRARVLDAQGRVRAETIRYLAVRTRGWVADTGASVMWVGKPWEDGDGTDDAFQPSAGAFAVLRYRGQREDRAGRSSGLWQTLAPGAGIAAVATPRSDGATEMAWMGTLHLFSDILQVGIGTTTDGTMVMGFGLGLHKIAGLGATFQ